MQTILFSQFALLHLQLCQNGIHEACVHRLSCHHIPTALSWMCAWVWERRHGMAYSHNEIDDATLLLIKVPLQAHTHTQHRPNRHRIVHPQWSQGQQALTTFITRIYITGGLGHGVMIHFIIRKPKQHHCHYRTHFSILIEFVLSKKRSCC